MEMRECALGRMSCHRVSDCIDLPPRQPGSGHPRVDAEMIRAAELVPFDNCLGRAESGCQSRVMSRGKLFSKQRRKDKYRSRDARAPQLLSFDDGGDAIAPRL